jgi:hypothetical protein
MALALPTLLAGLFLILVGVVGSSFNIVGLAQFNGTLRSLPGRIGSIGIGLILLFLSIGLTEGEKNVNPVSPQSVEDGKQPIPALEQGSSPSSSLKGNWEVDILPQEGTSKYIPPTPSDNSGKTTIPRASIHYVSPYFSKPNPQ